MKRLLAVVMIIASVLSCVTACENKCETCQFGEWETALEATCSAEGQSMRVCSVCGNKETKEIEKIEHTYGDWNVVAEPTCAEVGTKQRICSVCSAADTAEIKTIAHTYGDWEVINTATCSKAGSKARKCTVCSNEETASIEKTAHTYGAWQTGTAATCTTKGSRSRACSVCKYVATESVNAVGHSYGDWSVTKAATCTAKGVKTRNCSRCGAAETAEISIASHKVNKESGKCTVCNAQIQNPAGLASLIEITADWSPTTGAYTSYAKMKITNNSSHPIHLDNITINGGWLCEYSSGPGWNDKEFLFDVVIPAYSTFEFQGIFQRETFLATDTEGYVDLTWNGAGYRVYFKKTGITNVKKR